ncbi:hypothetical protein [Argonema antarcticum]|uniref:hypothetical protein n=1 Tax=Argonema antarcticum TaxID=2942763 RepID=UPI002013AAF9|nr:hypothetical protein [Argonema antarcticum]MCL1474467.1 hypothetical protein [Argonema antarcticum A004/B2]
MPSTTTSKLDNYNFSPLTNSKTIKLAKEIVELGSAHAAALGKINELALELGYKLLDLENAIGNSEVKQILFHCFPKEIVRYFRNLLCQAQLIEKCPNLYSRILEMPICHTAILLAGTEEQIVQILTSDTKWTVELLKERLKADNSSPALPIPEIAINAPVKIIADAPGYSGEIAIVQNITNDVIAIKLHSGEVGEFHISEVKPLCPDTYIELIKILATSNSLHASFKAAADSGDERLQNDIENKLSKLDKCRRQLIARLGLTDKAAKNLATYATASISVEEIATQENCNSTWRVWNIVEDDREPIIAKAQLLAKLRTKQILAQPTRAELAIACATILHKSTTKHSGGGIPISTREYSELTELVQEKDSTIQQLKVELDNVKALQAADKKDTEAPISDRLDDLQQEMESLRQSYQSIEQEYSRAMTELESYKQLVEKQADQIDSLTNSNPSVATTPPIFQPNDIVRIVENPNNALVNEIGIFKEVEIEDTICGSREKAVVVLKPGTKFQFPARIGNYEQSLAKIQLTTAEFKLLVEAEELARQNQDLTESVNYKEEKIDLAICQIGGCLNRLGVPGWYEKGVYIDPEGYTYSDARALEEGVKAIIEILVNIEAQPSYSVQPDEDIEF